MFNFAQKKENKLSQYKGPECSDRGGGCGVTDHTCLGQVVGPHQTVISSNDQSKGKDKFLYRYRSIQSLGPFNALYTLLH